MEEIENIDEGESQGDTMLGAIQVGLLQQERTLRIRLSFEGSCHLSRGSGKDLIACIFALSSPPMPKSRYQTKKHCIFLNVDGRSISGLPRSNLLIETAPGFCLRSPHILLVEKIPTGTPFRNILTP